MIVFDAEMHFGTATASRTERMQVTNSRSRQMPSHKFEVEAEC
jgi:hypothetical protein